MNILQEIILGRKLTVPICTSPLPPANSSTESAGLSGRTRWPARASDLTLLDYYTILYEIEEIENRMNVVEHLI